MNKVVLESAEVVGNEQANAETIREIEYLLRCASCECGW